MKGGKRTDTPLADELKERLLFLSSAPPSLLLPGYLSIFPSHLPPPRWEGGREYFPASSSSGISSPVTTVCSVWGVLQEQCYRICTACQDAKPLRGFWWTSNGP
ncbi:hypothetical protein M747DRAFT_54754 [Aspergillus niger ATCC 13496]|uniref:Uncharacterized protein n=1 Tax=Aspergillus niger ATCC 13496 TaxID=1353008 RepID=A0A370CDK7_ASPNG|nr:hypothetical protein M747DRAFT_54754 [Aspergillus niger ATCC 13496]